MGETGKKQAQDVIEKHRVATAALHAELRKHAAPADAAKLEAALHKHAGAQQGLENDTQDLTWHP